MLSHRTLDTVCCTSLDLAMCGLLLAVIITAVCACHGCVRPSSVPDWSSAELLQCISVTHWDRVAVHLPHGCMIKHWSHAASLLLDTLKSKLGCSLCKDRWSRLQHFVFACPHAAVTLESEAGVITQPPSPMLVLSTSTL